MKLSHGDPVIVISGKDKGKKGTVLRVLTDCNRVIVGGVNMVTKHIKKTAQNEGKKIQLEASLHVSNVQIIDPKTGKASRIGYRVDPKTGRKLRIAKLSGSVLTKVKVEKAAPATASVQSSSASGGGRPAAKKSPFWKKVGFGSQAVEDDAVKAEAGPAQATIQTRSAGRGS